jgi:putative ABC transport system permease protein
MRDVRYALRQMYKNPVFFAIVVLTLGLGIGANTAIFSLVDWLCLRSLPISHPEQMQFLVFSRPAGDNEVQFSYPEFVEMQKQTTGIFSGMAPFIFGGLEGAQNAQNGLTVDSITKPIQTVYVGSGFFSLLGIAPAAGRFLLSAEGKTAGADPVVILSYNYWQTRFGGDPTIVGRAAFLNGQAVTIVGITPKGFLGPTPLVEAQGYLPLGMYSIERGVATDFLTNPKTRSIVAFARLKPQAAASQMQSELAVVGRRLLKEYPRDQGIGELRAKPLRPPGLLSGDANPLPKLGALFLILGGLVLALACVNVANLFLVRTLGRQREMAVRAALGAGNTRLVRQLLTESLVIAALGCALGILLGVGTTRVLSSVPLQVDLPFVLDFGFNWHTFLYAFLVATASAVLVTLVPMIRTWRSNLQEILHEGGRGSTGGRQRLRGVLVASEVAACLTLLVISGLFVRSLRGVQHADLGFNPQSVLNLTLDANEIGYTEAQGRAFFSVILERTRALPGAQSASLASVVPLADNVSASDLVIPGLPPSPNQPAPRALYCAVSSDYFATNGITLIRGREFTAADNEHSAAVAVINHAMADRYWPGQDPVGRSFAPAADPNHPLTIVGVAGNVRMNELYGPFELAYYRPITQSYEGVQTLQIRSARSPQELLPEVRNIAQSISPTIPIYGVRTMTEILHGGNGLLLFELGASLPAILGLLGLVLTLVGLYGLTSYAVSQRTQEIGIRMALGAQRHDILRVIGRQGFFVIVIGLTAGLLVALTVGRLVSDFLVGITPSDPITYGGVSALLAIVALLATYVPVRRASRVDPMVALRHE